MVISTYYGRKMYGFSGSLSVNDRPVDEKNLKRIRLKK